MIINLKEEIGPNLIVRLDAEKLFKRLKEYSTDITMDFSGIEFINRTFAQEYLNRKFSVDYEIEEINLPDVVKNMFNVILEWNGYDMRYQSNRLRYSSYPSFFKSFLAINLNAAELMQYLFPSGPSLNS